jgi:hypothetical protein
MSDEGAAAAGRPQEAMVSPIADDEVVVDEPGEPRAAAG